MIVWIGKAGLRGESFDRGDLIVDRVDKRLAGRSTSRAR
jgi:hypothetical protein